MDKLEELELRIKILELRSLARCYLEVDNDEMYWKVCDQIKEVEVERNVR